LDTNPEFRIPYKGGQSDTNIERQITAAEDYLLRAVIRCERHVQDIYSPMKNDLLILTT